MSDDIRSLLEDVAAGRITPAEAAERLNNTQPDESTEGDSTRESSSQPETARVLIRAKSRSIDLVGDPSVTTVAVDGEHQIRREGDTLVVLDDSERLTGNAFLLVQSGRWRELGDWFSTVRHQRLTVRVNPDLPVGVEITAGSLTSTGAHALDHVRVTAGSVRLAGVTAPLDLLVQAGAAAVQLEQTTGTSRLRVESGSLKLEVSPASDVRITTDEQLGKVTVHPSNARRGDEIVVGAGAATMALEVLMGSAQVTVR